MKDAPLLNVVLVLALAIMIGWLMAIGRSVILPIVMALIAVYVLHSASAAISRLPGFKVLPLMVLRAAVLVAFAGVLFAAATVISSTVREILQVAPAYEANLLAMIDGLSARLNLDAQDVWDRVEAATIGRIDLDGLVLALLGGFSSVGGVVFLVVLYVAFLMGERRSFERRIHAAMPGAARGESMLTLLRKINANIGAYLAVKTLINLILGTISFLIMYALDVDFALFWAIVIGLLNYIPYVGSYLGVAFPVILSLGQFGDWTYSLLILAALSAAQFVVGNVLEPKLIGRQMNLSPFVVLVALAVWGTLWGVPGAILAVPMTSVIAIVLSEFEATRPIVTLLANRVDETGTQPVSRN
ncbi:AI-2E family transporter [Sulfitobacter sp. D35]|uniref:AI-2E family transporter n=1 Tax=Sulfitobacter sp. D35 TaxID=3083252 RepID=UPI00296EAD07|nr:AI-2E family transporter [Sulfitobacter sp. D35]MDW4496675.1 AI-2E family transporter [Sulfitobacter sp. D35]